MILVMKTGIKKHFNRTLITSLSIKLTEKWGRGKLPKRPKDANKGTFGKLLVFAGSDNFPGAAYLACAAAYRIGTGLVKLAATKNVQQIVSKKLPEVTFISLRAELSFNGIDACLIGPGLGQGKEAIEITEKVLAKMLPPSVIDADGLNILSNKENWWEKINGSLILMPHPGEMSRLSGVSIEQIQKNRIYIAQRFAKEWRQTVVLKGANTVIASSSGEIAVSPFANPILATAGTGDILAGIVAGLLAQGLNPMDAASLGVFIHGLAGEFISKKIGDRGMLATDLLLALPEVIKHLKKTT